MRKISIPEEISLINRFFTDYRVRAEVRSELSFVAGKSFVVFGIRLGPGTRIVTIENCLRELAERLSLYRNQATAVRLRQMPLALEVPHPNAEPLLIDPQLSLEPHAMLLGKSYTFAGEQTELVNLYDTPHILIAGTTGSGKSNLLTTMLYTLCRFTSPAEVNLVLIDLKNEDLQPFVGLPHVSTAAMSIGAASEAISWVLDEKDRRVKDRHRGEQRLVLVIDELAEMTRIKGAMQQLASVLAIGRSKRINVIAATQKPIASVVGSTNKANFTLRLVGRVLSADDSRVAAGQSGTGAEFLPGKGSFLRVDGAEVRRFQAHYLEDAESYVEPVKMQWHEQLSFPLSALRKAVQP